VFRYFEPKSRPAQVMRLPLDVIASIDQLATGIKPPKVEVIGATCLHHVERFYDLFCG